MVKGLQHKVLHWRPLPKKQLSRERMRHAMKGRARRGRSAGGFATVRQGIHLPQDWKRIVAIHLYLYHLPNPSHRPAPLCIQLRRKHGPAGRRCGILAHPSASLVAHHWYRILAHHWYLECIAHGAHAPKEVFQEPSDRMPVLPSKLNLKSTMTGILDLETATEGGSVPIPSTATRMS